MVPLPPTINDLLGVSPSLVADLSQPEGPVQFDDNLGENVPGAGVQDP